MVVSAARHAYDPALAVATERTRKPVSLGFLGIALRLSVGIAVSAAAIWFVLLPAIHEKPASLQSCDVVLLANGTVGCANLPAPANGVNKPKVREAKP